MASLLAEMPDSNPEQLMQWIAQRDADVTQRIEQTNKMADAFRHEMGTLALKKVMGNSQAEGAQAPPEASPDEMPAASAPAGGNSMGL